MSHRSTPAEAPAEPDGHPVDDAAVPARPSRAPAARRAAGPAGREGAARPARDQRSNGQWAVDGHDPLNANEVMKQKDGGLNVRQRIEEIYSREGFDSIPSEDLHGRFRWWGLYTQRRPGIDGGRTAQLEPHEISDRYFMLRVRIDGGALTTEQLRVVAGISTELARDTADVTDRQNIQLHWVEVESVPEIWRRLEAVGLQTTEACGDTPRVVLGSPVAGIAADELIDSTPAVEAISRRFIGDPAFANLPRKFKTAVTGHPSLDVVHEINDVSFVGVQHPELGVGYDLWVGGGLSTSAHLAVRLGAFVTEAEVPEVWAGVTGIFRDYGYRRLRNKARLKYLVADWGAEKFRQVLQDEYLHRTLPDGPAPPPATSPGDHVGVHAQKDGRFYVGVAPVVGRVSGTMLAGVADVAERAGSTRVRLTPYQKLVVLDVPADAVDDVVAGLADLGLQAAPGRFRRHTIACTGIEYCKLAIVETKITAAHAIEELDRRLSGIDLDRPITLHVNGCPNSCARIQTADIGLKGQLVPTPDGGQEPGFQVHLGGGLASQDRDEPGLGRTVRGLKVTAADLPDYVERLVRRYLSDRDAGESFATWAHRAEEGALQ
jgi:sulfite reductase (ferredoxin)